MYIIDDLKTANLQTTADHKSQIISHKSITFAQKSSENTGHKQLQGIGFIEAGSKRHDRVGQKRSRYHHHDL
jgi:hypothetical protein